MGLFNLLYAQMRCPRCFTPAKMEIELFFGLKNQIRYQLGDELRWRGGKSVNNGGRPSGGKIDGEGYTECPTCGKDFFVRVIVRNDVIQAIEVDSDKEPYIKA
jgi:hypothetical protein